MANVPAGPGVLAHYTEGPRSMWIEQEAAGALVAGFGATCEFRIDLGSRTIDVLRDRRAADGLPARLLESTLLAFLLALQNVTLLHASAVEHQGHGFLLAGRSGIGKSTVAAWLCSAAGAAVVSDDAVRLEIGESESICWRGTTGLRLRESANTLAERLPGHRGGREVDGRRLASPTVARSPLLPVAAIVIPAPSPEAEQISVDRLSPRASLVGLLGAARTAGWRIDAPRRGFLGFAVELARRVPVLRAAIPWGPPFEPEVGRTLLQAIEACAHNAPASA